MKCCSRPIALLPNGLILLVIANCGQTPTPKGMGHAESKPSAEHSSSTEPTTSQGQRGEFAIQGVVRDATGQPVLGAEVALIRSGEASASAHATSDEFGKYEVRAVSGSYALTATARGHGAAYSGIFSLAANGARELSLERDGRVISGRVTEVNGKPLPFTLVRLLRVSSDDGDIFYTRTDAEGGYQVSLLAGDKYRISATAPEFLSPILSAADDGNETVDLSVTMRRPAPPAVVEWLKQHVVRIDTATPRADLSDLEGLKHAFGAARVVALGEATHGTREFFQLKHRLLQYMVEELGFRVFAIEANFTESLAINEYVLGGKGDPRALLDDLLVWPWATEEVVDQIEWMRRYNQTHQAKVKFYGVDMQWAVGGVKAVVAYLRVVDPERARWAEQALQPMGNFRFAGAYASMPESRRKALAAAIDELAMGMDAKRRAYVKRSNEQGFLIARQNANVVRQTHQMAAAGPGLASRNVRDGSMAANVQWILSHEPAGTKLVFWGHNGHIARGDYGFSNAGSQLAEALGSAYVACGFAFGHGAFQALEFKTGKDGNRVPFLRRYNVGRSKQDFLEAGMARVGHPIFAIDLRTSPAGIVKTWLHNPIALREIGASFDGESGMESIATIDARYDVLLYVDQTTRARPTGKWRKRSDMSTEVE